MENDLELWQEFKELNLSVRASLVYVTRELKSIQDCIISVLKVKDKTPNADIKDLINYYWIQAKVILDFFNDNFKNGMYNYIDGYLLYKYKCNIINIYNEIATDYYDSLD